MASKTRQARVINGALSLGEQAVCQGSAQLSSTHLRLQDPSSQR